MEETVLFARQPIFDGHQHVQAYELLFRNGDSDEAKFIDGDLATKSVLLNAYVESSAPTVLNGKPGFLNVSRVMIAALPTFARQFLVVEVLEDFHSQASLEEELAELRKRGFQIALDDFEVSNYRESLLELVDIVKLDVFDYSEQELIKVVNLLSRHSVQLLAEKVETPEMFKLCKSLGFELFQGYFFCKPELVKGHVLNPSRRSVLDLLRQLYQPEVDSAVVVEIVKRDVALSYKLLKLVNSSFYRRTTGIDSIEHAVNMLGLERIRSWITLLALGDSSKKTDELQKETLLRAHMCEKLAENLDRPVRQMVFSAGMLSCIDAWFDHPMKELLSLLPISETLTGAILYHQGVVGQLLSLSIDYIHCDWEKISQAKLDDLFLSIEHLGLAYSYGIERTDQISMMMAEESF